MKITDFSRFGILEFIVTTTDELRAKTRFRTVQSVKSGDVGMSAFRTPRVRKKNAWKNGVVDLTADYITTSKSSDKPVMFCFMRGASFLLSVGRLISVVGCQKCEGHTKWKCLPVMFCPSLYLHLSQTNTDMLSCSHLCSTTAV
jgi:hypothetical protein